MTHSDDFLGAAGFAFEKQRGVRLSSYEVNEIEAAGLVDADCEHLADIIWASLEEPQIEDYRISAYWALGKRWRETDVPKFIETLRRELPRSGHAVFQILVALENCGEEPFDPRRTGRSISEVELNRADAIAYLLRFSTG